MASFQLSPFETVRESSFIKRERVQAALEGTTLDRPPVAFFHHFTPDGSAGALANATVDFFARRFDQDIVKIPTDIRYPLPANSIRQPTDWRLVDDWGSTENAFTRAYVSAVRQARATLGPGYPLVVTVYSSMQWALMFAGGAANLLADLATHPDLVHGALANIAVNMRRLATACIAAGADGVYLCVLGCDDTVPQAIYNEIGRPYDLMILQGAQDGWLRMVHVHSEAPEIRVDDILAYPVNVMSWASTTTGKSIASVRAQSEICIMAGWDEHSPLLTDPDADTEAIADVWFAQARDALEQAGNRGLFLAPGCSIPNNSTDQAMRAFRAVVDRLDGGVA